MNRLVNSFKILIKIFKASLMQHMEYRLNFFLRSTFEIAILLSNIIFFNVIYKNVNTIGGWTKKEAFMLVVITAILDCSLTLLFVEGLSQIPALINNGTLDFILLKPISKRVYLSFKSVNAPQILNLLILFIIMGFLVFTSDTGLGLKQISVFILLILNSIFILYNIFFLIMILSFWIIKVDAGLNMFFQLYYIGNKPMSIYPNLIQKFFTYVIPLFVAFNYPIIHIFKGLSHIQFLNVFSVSLVLFCLSQWLFKCGLRKYSSASS